MRPLAFLALLSLPSALLVACERPVAVNFQGAGAKDLALRGEVGVKGHLTRTLVLKGKKVPKGTEVLVSETFLVRKEGGKPPAYRFDGLYDASKMSDGFMLPEGSAETFYIGLVEPDRRQRVPVPKEYFERAKDSP